MNRHFASALVALAALLPSGCCALAQMACGFPVPKSPPRGNRDTPDAAVDYLVDSFRRRATNDIYASFHPAFTAENGAFSASDFSIAYSRYEADFAADAETMSNAKRRIGKPSGGVVLVELTDEKTGAYLPLTFENRPRALVATTHPIVPTVEGAVDLHALVRLEDGRLVLPARFPLTAIEGVTPETAALLSKSEIVRVEFSDDWLVRRVDAGQSKNIRFVDKIKEHLPQ